MYLQSIADVMYLEEAVGPLVASLAGLCGGQYNALTGAATKHCSAPPSVESKGSVLSSAAAVPAASGTTVILAHGRNRFAEATFWHHTAAAGFKVEAVPWDELDSVYRCSDVDVYRLRLESAGNRGAA